MVQPLRSAILLHWTPKRGLGWWGFSDDTEIRFDRVWLYDETRKHRTLKGTSTGGPLIRGGTEERPDPVIKPGLEVDFVR